MNRLATIRRLNDIFQRIAQAKSWEAIEPVILYEWSMVLDQSPALRTEYEARVHYYANWSTNGDYLVLLDAIHSGFSRLHGVIACDKLPAGPNSRFPNFFKVGDGQGSVDMQQMLSLLTNRQQWQ